jgi:AAA+ superfamily predicted ATPase
MHGATLLHGPSGTGKTTLARSAPNELIKQLGRNAILLEINTHSLPGAERGACQKNIRRLFDQLGEVASTGCPVFAVINELETLASSRQSISLATNPLDTSFAVNALIESIDCVAARYSNIFFLATTNLPEQVDSAIFDRFDDVFHVDLPDSADRLRILAKTIESLQPHLPLAEQLRRGAALKSNSRNKTDVLRASDKTLLQVCDQLAKATSGMSPRRLSQLPVRCLGIRSQELSSSITFKQLITAAGRERRTR